MICNRFPDCPFCGSDDLIDPDGTDSVECNSCGAWAESEQKWKARVRPAALLQWSEPDAEGDIRAGDFIIEQSEQWNHPDLPIYLAKVPREIIGNFNDIALAKLTCERHVRKMLGWDS